MGIDAISAAKRRAVKEIITGYKEAFGRSWYEDHPGQEPTVDTEPISEAMMRYHYYKNGEQRAECPKGCTAARWRSFKAMMRRPEYYALHGCPMHETRSMIYK